MKKFLPLIIFVVLAGFLYNGLGRDTKLIPSPLIGKDFPNLIVEDFQTMEKFPIHDRLLNKVSLVNVWASWCVTCRAEHQMLVDIAKSNSVQMVGINYKDTKKEGNRFLELLSNPFDFIVFDNQGKLGLELGVYATPETFVIDKTGVIRYKRIGEVTPVIWREQILPIITKLENK